MLRQFLLGVLICSSLAPRPVRGQDDAGDAAASADYEVALSEALAAHARGDYAQARIFMEQAHRLEPSARTLRGLAIVSFAQGRHADAIRYLDAALASQAKPLPAELRASVEELLRHAWGQVGRYELRLEPAGGELLIDGRPPDLYAPHTVILAPGNHLLSARAPARAPYQLAITVSPGEQRSLHVVLAAPSAPAPPGVLAPEQGTWWTPTKRGVALGAAGALIASGGALWALAYVRLERIADDCRDQADGVCTQREATGAYRRENIEGLGISAAVLLSTGAAVLLGVGVVEIWHKANRPAHRRDLALLPGMGSLAVRTRF